MSVGLLVALLFVLAVALRLPGLTDRVFNSDEAYLATQAQVLNHGGRLYVDTVDRKPPLVPYLYATVFRVTGTDDLAAVRVIAVLAQIATALLLALEARRRFTWRHAALAAGVLYLLASSAFPPADAQAANFEIYMLPLMTLSFVLAVRERPIGAGVSLALATLTKQTAALAVLPVAYLAWRARRRRGLLLLCVSFVVPVVVAGAALGPRDFAHWVFTSNGGYVDVRGAIGYAFSNGLAVHGLVPVRQRGAHRALAVGVATSPPGSRPVAVAPLRGGGGAHRLPLLSPLLPSAPAGTRAAGDPRVLDSLGNERRRRVVPVVAVLAVVTTLSFVAPAFTNGDNRDTKIALDVANVRALTHRDRCACARVGPSPRGVLELGPPSGDSLRDDRVRHRRLGRSTAESGRNAVRGTRRRRSVLPGSRRDAACPHRRHVDR